MMAEPAPMSARDRLALGDPWMLAALLLLAAAALVAAQFVGVIALSADLKALWVAGQFWETGRPELVYPPEAPLFTMTPPEDWITWLRDEHDYGQEIYPFLYPPIWAVLTAWVSGPTFEGFAAAMLWINSALIAGTVALAIRATRAALNPLLHAVLVLGVFAVAPVVVVALAQGQPQILVSFLTVLAIERARADAQIAAGVALGVAAAMKLFPAVYVVFWIARGEWRAVASFAVTGAALALASVGLAGWGLHMAFLDTVAQVGRTILVTGAALNVDAILAQLFFADSLTQVTAAFDVPGDTEPAYWYVMARPALWSALENAGLLALLAGFGLAARRARPEVLYTALWPAALILTVLLSPIGWIYYVIPAAAFSPVLIARLGPALGSAFWFAGAFAIYAVYFDFVQEIAAMPMPKPFFTVTGVAIWAAGFLLSARRAGLRAPDSRPE